MRMEPADILSGRCVTVARRMAMLAAAVAVLGFTGVLAGPASAQTSWEPVVATAPGGTLRAPAPVERHRLPSMVDPRRFPPPVRAPAAGAEAGLPQGATSPLVTGAIPVPRSPTAEPTARSDATATRRDALSPVRPTRGAAVAAAPASEDGDARQLTTDGGEEATAVSPDRGPLDALPPDATPAQQYCFNTTDTAADARFAWQARKIQEMEAELNKRAEVLEAKTNEYKTWLARRDEFSRKAHEKLVGFYSRMRADAAAAQLATIDEETAAAVLTKLETKVASQIMGEMDPARAARIATVISGAAKTGPARVRKKGGAPPRERNAGNSRRRPES